MAVIRQNNKVFNRPVGIVRSQETSSTSDLWKSISEASNAVSAIAMRKAVDDAQTKGSDKAMSVEVLDENGNITKAPVNFGPVASKAFEQNMMQRYEIQMKSLLDTKINEALANNSSNAEDFNNSASISTGALIDNAEPSFQGILKDYVATKIGAGQNTVLANRLRIESEKNYALITNQADTYIQQAINQYEIGNKEVAEQRFEEATKLLDGMIDSQDATASQVLGLTNELRRQFVKAKLGQEVQGMSSKEIQVVLNEYVQGNLKDDGSELKTMLTTFKPEDFETAKRTLTNLEQNQGKIENNQAKQLERMKLFDNFSKGVRTKIGTKEMQSYSEYAFAIGGLEFNNNPSVSDITQLAGSQDFLSVLAQQQTIPDVIKFKLEDMVNGIMGDKPDEVVALMEFYQSLENNVSRTGVPRDITSAVGLDGQLRTKLQGISRSLTFNNTPEGLTQVLALANQPEKERISNALTKINDSGKSNKFISSYDGARNFVLEKLGKEFEDNGIAEEVVDETLMLMNLVSYKDALSIMKNTVEEKWKNSQYTVDYNSGGTAIRTRFAPETIFGQGTKVLQDFEQAVIDKSGVANAELGKNVFVMVDPNSSNTNVRYYLMKGEEGIGGIEPVIKDGKLVSIELLEYADDMREQYENVLLENLSYASQLIQSNKELEEYLFLNNPTMQSQSLDEQFDVDLSGAKNTGYGF